MALIAAISDRAPDPAELSLRNRAPSGYRWLSTQGFPRERITEEMAVRAGYAVAMLGSHLPDLAMELAEELDLPYYVSTTATTSQGMTFLRRGVSIGEREP